MTIYFTKFKTHYEGEELVINTNEISSINSSSESNISTIRMKNGDEFDVEGSAYEILELYYH